MVDTGCIDYGWAPPKRQCEEMVAQTAEDFEAYYEATVGNKRGQSNLLVVTTDSKGMVMRREDLRRRLSWILFMFWNICGKPPTVSTG